jgi:hypothetical protein
MVKGDQLRERPARRDADQVRGRDLVGVEHAGGVGDQVIAGVPGTARLVGDRSPRVAMVVADQEPPAVGEHPAEPLLPPEHRGADPHDQEDRRIPRIAEGLGAEPDAVRLDQSLGHPGPPIRSRDETI